MTQDEKSNGDSFMSRVREQLRANHDGLEQLPFFDALRKKTLPVESYVGLLRALAVIHATLERSLPEADCAAVQAIWHEGLRKLPLLQKDLAFFEPRRVPDVVPAAESALAMAERILLRSVEDQVSLLGYLYVLEGSTRGSVTTRQWFSAALSLKPEEGLAYFTNYGNAVEQHWKQFATAMEVTLQDPADQETVITAACEAYEGMAVLFGSLYPLGAGVLRNLATSINPEAGRHPIPSDPTKVEAALRASDISWRRLSYYEMRYGERGKRFSDSDSAWLATLVEYDQETVNQQTQWLGRVLAGRGLPRWTMEVHLQVLAEELEKAKPERMHDYEKLRLAEAELRKSRLSHFDEELGASISQGFLAQAPGGWVRQLPQTIDLILSAVADEKEGIANAVESLAAWLMEETRFPEEWRVAVRSALQNARCGSSGPEEDVASS